MKIIPILVSNRCPNCNCPYDYESFIQFKMHNSDLDFCSTDCALEYSIYVKKLLQRKIKIEKLKNGIQGKDL